MTHAQIVIGDRATTKKLILDAKGGVLTGEEVKALDKYLHFSSQLYIGLIDEQLCCAWGVVPPSLLSDRAYLWLFSTELVDEYKFLFVRRSQIVIRELLEEYPVITGYCAIGSPRSMRWLRWLGAVFFEPHGKYLPFEIRKR